MTDKHDSEWSISKFIGDSKNYITNLDPDGITSYLLLKNFIGGELVGFTNSNNYVYLFRDKNIGSKAVTYVDMFVTNPNIKSIDQHIVGRNYNENRQLYNLHTKYNPNIIFKKDLSDYRHKFPLSSFLFILITLSREYDITIDFKRKVSDNLEVGHFLLDIDGVMTNLRDYLDNVTQWLDLLRKEFNTRILDELCNYINELPMLELSGISQRVRNFLTENYCTETKDGGFNSITETNIVYIKRLMAFYNNIIFNNDGGDIGLGFDYRMMDVFYGERKLCNSNEIDLSNTFSYAIVRKDKLNISYTEKLKKVIK